jgi:AAHS family 4-hydroxybenzoate transporter-like MFS transporter
MAATGPITFSDAISRAPLKTFSIVTFAICMLVLIADGMDAQLLGIVAPIVLEEFGVDRSTFGIAVMAALVGFGLGSWGGGWLGDKIGRRWSLAIGTVIFSAATMGASLAADVWQMAAWRLVSGLGFGAAYATAITLTGDWLPDRWRSVGVTTISVGTPAGGTVVGALAPTLVEDFGWRGTFLAIGAGTMLMVVLIVLILRESPAYLLAKGRTKEAHAVAAKVLDAPFELVAEQHATDRDGASIGVFHPSNFRLNLGVGVAFAAAAMVAYGMLNWGTTFLTAKGFPFDEASYAVSVGGVTSMAAAIVTGLLVHRFGSRPVFLAIATSLVLTMTVLALKVETMSNTPGGAERLLVIGLYGLAAALFSAAIAGMYAVMTYAYPSACRSAGIGFGIFVARIGAIAGSGLGGTLIDIGQGSMVPFFGTLIAVSALVFAAPLVIDRHVPPAARRAARTVASRPQERSHPL